MRPMKHLILVLGVVILSIAAQPAYTQEPMRLIEMIPQTDVVVYAHMNLRALIPAIESVSSDRVADSEFMTPLFGEDATVGSQLLSWMGDEVAFVYRFTDQDVIDSTIGQAMVIVPVSDMNIAMETLTAIVRNFETDLVEMDATIVEETLDINGMQVNTWSVSQPIGDGDGIYFSMALWDGFAAIGNSTAIQGMINVLTGDDPANLSLDADYQATMDTFEIEPDTHIYLSPHGIRAVDNLMSNGLSQMLFPRPVGMQSDDTRGVSFAVHIADDVWQMELVMNFLEESLQNRFGADVPPLQLETNTLSASNHIPANAMAAFLWSNVGESVRYLRDDASSILNEGAIDLEEGITALTAFGYDLDNDFLSQLTGTMSAYLTYNPDSNASCDFSRYQSDTPYDMGLVMPVTDTATAAETFERVQATGVTLGGAQVKPLDSTLLEIYTDESASEPGIIAGLRDDTIIATNTTGYESMVDMLDGTAQSLADTPQWQRATAYLPENNQYPIVYVDLLQLNGVIDQQNAAGQGGEDNLQLQEFIQRFETMLMWMNFDDNRAVFHLDFLVSDGREAPTLPPLGTAACN